MRPEEQPNLRLAALSGLIEQQVHEAVRKIAASSESLLRGVESQVQAAVAQAAERAVEPCAKQLVRSAESAKWAADAMGEQRRTLSRTQQSLVYLGLASLIIGCLLVLAATIYWVKTSREEVARNHVEAELLHAINQADITLCDGRLCANVEAREKRRGDRKQYRLVEPRPNKPMKATKEPS